MSIERVGVAGAGTMGAGIAQIASLGGLETALHDPDSEALDRGMERLRDGLAKGAARGRWSEAEAEAAAGRVSAAPRVEDLAGCELVIEAAPEDLAIKRELFASLAAACGPNVVLATNTSSLSVSEIAAEVAEPDRVVGTHFFNPPALMELVEVIAGDESSNEALDLATEACRRMGRTPIRARDAIGFVANRCARPFTLESLRMLGEGAASHEEIDRVCRVGGGFRMGPFELMDLIGIDVNFGVACSFYERSFGEPRWRPHPIQARMVASGRLGRKTGRGFYDYGAGEAREPDPEIDDDRPILDEGRLEAVAGEKAPRIIGRIGAGIVNEAAFALGDRVASAEDIDTAMRLGFNWPLGPIEWAERLGGARALGVLDELRDIHGDAYRPAPLLRRAVSSGVELRELARE